MQRRLSNSSNKAAAAAGAAAAAAAAAGAAAAAAAAVLRHQPAAADSLQATKTNVGEVADYRGPPGGPSGDPIGGDPQAGGPRKGPPRGCALAFRRVSFSIKRRRPNGERETVPILHPISGRISQTDRQGLHDALTAAAVAANAFTAAIGLGDAALAAHDHTEDEVA